MAWLSFLLVASGVVLDAVPDEAGATLHLDRQRAGDALQRLFAAIIDVLRPDDR